ncbi:MAG: sugar ABC transporter permease, partial [Boseongicola sp. SB0673_bin_14]|nr:sugar ABC transporter permease [Boseongicola sp. SB0673_bin_14]
FKVFDIVWATTQGGPIRFSEILSTYMYKRGALENQYGYGSAIGVALLVIVSLATVVYMQIQSKENR